jgi:hypothetical protein
LLILRFAIHTAAGLPEEEDSSLTNLYMYVMTHTHTHTHTHMYIYSACDRGYVKRVWRRIHIHIVRAEEDSYTYSAYGGGFI